MAKWLTRSGWDVTVVTPDASVWKRPEDPRDVDRTLEAEGIRCLRTPHSWKSLASGHLIPFYAGLGPVGERLGARLTHWGRQALARLEIAPEFGWVRDAERLSFRAVLQGVDLVLATGPPFSVFAAARRVAARLGCPYVLDYRDLWFGNPWAKGPTSEKELAAERLVLRDAAAVTTASAGLRQFLGATFDIAAKTHLISNGYDPEELAPAAASSFDNPAIVYAGIFYPPRRRIDPILEALARLEEKPPSPAGRWTLHYFGRHDRHVLEAAQRLGIQSRVILHGDVPHEQALSALRGAAAALIINSVDDTREVPDRTGIPAKIYEAIGLGTPVLAIAPAGSDVEAVVRTAGRGRCFAGNEVEQMASYLLELAEQRLPQKATPEEFDWSHLGLQLDAVLRDVVNDRSSNRDGVSSFGPR